MSTDTPKYEWLVFYARLLFGLAWLCLAGGLVAAVVGGVRMGDHKTDGVSILYAGISLVVASIHMGVLSKALEALRDIARNSFHKANSAG